MNLLKNLGRKHTPQVNTVEYKQKQFSDEKKPYLRSSDRGKKEKKKETNGPAPKKFCWICGDPKHMSGDRPNKKTKPSVNLLCKDDAKKSEERKLDQHLYVEGRSLTCMLNSEQLN